MLEAIAKSEKPDATLFDHLGDIYSALNRHSEAREAWNQSLQVEDNPEVRRKLESAPSR
jgi:predicted negative regulator of RcsB-dependent stress response